MDELVQAIAEALDEIEAQILGASTNHGKRIAVLCTAMGRHLGMNEDELTTLATCALFHDNALTEYLLEEYDLGRDEGNHSKLPGQHCIYGQRNVDELPMPSDSDGLVLYHHEWANGNGPFGKKEGEFPLGAELISIADSLDVKYHLQRVSTSQLTGLRQEITENIHIHYTERAAEALLAVLDESMLLSLRDEAIRETAVHLIPAWEIEAEDDTLVKLADFAAHIIDYKSHFTRNHTVWIASRSLAMSSYYGFSREKQVKIYLACALHDIGKLYIPSNILEKPGELTDSEFVQITDHIRYTYKLLKDIKGFEQICTWASNHHEKLDGSGYPFGRSGDELDFVSRLLVCLDIYQAVSEERPYHPGRSHQDTMSILYSMAEAGKVDLQITKDLDVVMRDWPVPTFETP